VHQRARILLGLVPQLGEGIFQLVPQALEAAGEIEDGAAGVGEDEFLGGAVNQFFAQLGFEALQG